MRKEIFRLVSKSLVLVPSLYVAAIALAEEHGESGGHAEPNWITLIALTLNVIILFGVVIYYAKGPLARSLEAKRREAEKLLQETTLLRQEAENKLNEYQKKLSELDKEISRLEKEFQEDGKREQARILSSAQETAEKIIRTAETTAEHEIKKMRQRLVTETALAAVEIAERIITEKISEDDRRKLAEEYIEKIEKEVKSSVIQ